MPTFLFSSPKDSRYLARREAEKHRLYYQPRRWLVHQRDTTPLNVYGEPGEIEPVEATDGATSASAIRQLTSASVDFVTSGVQVTDILEIFNQPCTHPTSNDGDNGRYTVEQVTANVLTVDQDWPAGDLVDLDFKVHILKERYVYFDQLIPFLVKLNPTEKVLENWGIVEKRDCMIELSYHLCEELSLEPKIGDRFILPYGTRTVTGSTARNIHYELKNLFESDQLGDSGIPLHLIGFAKRVTGQLP